MTGFTTTQVLDGQDKSLPPVVKAEIERLWDACEYGNDSSYYRWQSKWSAEDYPVIDKYLKEQGVTDCLIHYWW